MFEYIYNTYTKHDKKLPSLNGNHTGEYAVLGRFVQDMREKLLLGAANADEERGCAMIKLYASREEAVRAAVSAQQSDEWTEDKLKEFSTSLTKFQKKLGRIGKSKRPVPGDPRTKAGVPFSQEEQLIGYRIKLDFHNLRRGVHATNAAHRARMKIYAKHGLVESMPDWDGESSSAFTIAEMLAWNSARRIVVNEPVYKPAKRAASKHNIPSNAGLLANSNLSPRSTRAKRKPAVEGSSSAANNRHSKRTKAPQQVEEEEACKLAEDELSGVREERIVPGIINEENTCYAASFLQLLFSSEQFVIDLFNTYNAQSSLGKELPLTEAVLNVAKDIGLINEEGVVQSVTFTTVTAPASVAADPERLKLFMAESMNDHAASLLELKTIVDGKVDNFHDVINPNDVPEEKDVYV